MNELGIEYTINSRPDIKIEYDSKLYETGIQKLTLPPTIEPKKKKLSPLSQKILTYCKSQGDKIDIRQVEALIPADGYKPSSAYSGIKELIKYGYFARIGKGKYIRTAKR